MGRKHVVRVSLLLLTLFHPCLQGKEPSPDANLPGSSDKEGLVNCEDDRFTAEKYCEVTPLTVVSGSGNPWILIGAAMNRGESGTPKAWLTLNYVGGMSGFPMKADHSLYLLLAGKRQQPILGSYDYGTFLGTFHSERSVVKVSPDLLRALCSAGSVESRWGAYEFPFGPRLCQAIRNLTSRFK